MAKKVNHNGSITILYTASEIRFLIVKL